MKITILLLLCGVCIVAAKYIPNEWDNSEQLLSRYKRSDSDESDGSSEDENDSNNDDGDLQNRDENDEKSKQIAKMEKMRQKLLDKQEKERKRQEEIQRKLEEKIAKQLEKEEEKRQKEKRKQEEKLEKERKKLEEQEKKIQEKILENEKKQQERIQKELEEMEKNTRRIQESSESYADDSIQELLKVQIYSKYGINEASTNLEKKETLRRYLQEEVGLDANSTVSEQRKAILDLVQNKLQNASESVALQNQLIEYIKYIGVQKIRGKIEKDIEKLQNKTETLSNVNNSTWAPSAKQNIAEQVSFLESIKQILPNVLPPWFSGSQQVNLSVSPDIDNKNLRNPLKIPQDSNNSTQEGNVLDITNKKAIDSLNSVSLSNSNLGEVILGTQNSQVSINEVTSNNPMEISSNGVIFTSSVVSETPLVDSELGQNISPLNVISSINVESNIPFLAETQNITNITISSTFGSSPNIVDQKVDVSSNDSNISNIVSVYTMTEPALNSIVDIALSPISTDAAEPSSILPGHQLTKVSVLSANNNESFGSNRTNSPQVADVNLSLKLENSNKPTDNQNIDRSNNTTILSTTSVDVTAENDAVLMKKILNETSSLLPTTKYELYDSQNIKGSSNNSSVSNLLPVDTTTEVVSNVIINTALPANSADNTSSLSSSSKVTEVNSPLVSVKNNDAYDSQNVNGSNIPYISNSLPVVVTTEKVSVPFIDTTPSVNLAGDVHSSSMLSSAKVTEVNPSLIAVKNNETINSQNVDGSNIPYISNIISVVASTENISVPIIDTTPSVNLTGEAKTSATLSIPDLTNEISSLLSRNINESYDSQNINSSSNNSSVLNSLAVDATTEFVSNLIINSVLSVNSADNVPSLASSAKVTELNPSVISVKNNESFDSQNVDGSKIPYISNIVPVVATTENVSVPIIDTTPSVNLAGEAKTSATLSIPDLTNEISSLLSRNINESYDSQNINSSSNNSSVPTILPAETTTEFVSNLISNTDLSAKSVDNTSFSSSSPKITEAIPPLISVNNNEPNISTIISVVATTENVPNSIIHTILPENTVVYNSTSDLVFGNNTELSKDKNVTDSSKNVTNTVEVTTEYVPNPVEAIISVNFANIANSSSSSPNVALSEATPNVVSEINTESSNNILKQVIVSVEEAFDVKNNAHQNVSYKSDNNTNLESINLQSILFPIPSTTERVEVINQTISLNQSAIDISGIVYTEQETLNEVTSLSTEQSVIAETTLQEVLTKDNILKNTEATPINTVPKETGALIIDVVKQ